MCEFQWTALAEFYLCNKDFPEEIYCLCSRVFTWANDDVNDEFIPSEDIDLKEIKDPTENLQDDALESDTIKYCAKGEPVSCYCSASHTDNISTDEHDSLRDSHASTLQQTTTKTLQLSDSGADLTADVGCSNPAWQKYWAVNGERLIWESWIAKYSAYINPDYLQNHQGEGSYHKDLSNEDLLNYDKGEGSGSLKFSFDSLSPHQEDYSSALGLGISLLQVKETESKPPEVVEKNRMLIRNLSYSDSYDKLNREIEGWNPLSPVSNDCETEAERLLSSRCASRTGSSARTVDSMTNVTRLTVSSFDLSESSKNSDSFSSVSSIQSSITSTSSEDAEEPGDYEQQWNVLWSKHYEQEYLDHYKKFLLDSVRKPTGNTDESAELEEKSEIRNTEESFESYKEDLPVNSKIRRRRARQKGAERKVIDSVGYILKNLIKIEETPVQEEIKSEMESENSLKNKMELPSNIGGESQKTEETNSNIDFDGGDSKPEIEVDLPSNYSNISDTTGSQTVEEQKSIDLENEIMVYQSKTGEGSEGNNPPKMEFVNSVEEEAAMSAMGIPLSFGNGKQFLKNSNAHTRKRSLEDDSDQSSSNRIKAAFTLLGIEMDISQEKRLRGSIEYKMKHIRSQNRRLQFRNENKNQLTSRHIHFDDDGELIPDIATSNEVTVQNSHQDELSGMIPSSSTENEVDMIPEEKPEVQIEESVSKKRKRKRKIYIPLEIRENPNLKKFWHRRYSLFSKFDQGIKLDEESWFSVTPEMVAQHAAKRCQSDVIIDAFCGAGGNTIQFAFTCKKVIAVDIDAKKIELARHNAQIYGVADRIEFIVGDFFQLAGSLKADTVFLSPPWGGPQYRNFSNYDLEWLQPAPFSELISTARKITNNIALFLPKNSNTFPLIAAAGPGGKMEIEQNFLGKRLIAITAYYNKLVNEVPLQKNSKEVN